MKYIAVLDDDFLSNFRLDDYGLTLVVNDDKGCTRGIPLKPLAKEMMVATNGESVYLSQKHIDCLLKMEHEEAIKEAIKNMFPIKDESFLEGVQEDGNSKTH